MSVRACTRPLLTKIRKQSGISSLHFVKGKFVDSIPTAVDNGESVIKDNIAIGWRNGLGTQWRQDDTVESL